MLKYCFPLFVSLSVIACNNQASEINTTSPEVTEVDTPVQHKVIAFPYPATYSSDWTIGDPELILKVMEVYKHLELNTLDSIKHLLADSITFDMYDNRVITATKDDWVKRLKAYREDIKAFKEDMQTYVSLHSNDKNADWVMIWIKESVVRLNGRKDSTLYQESWEFIDGKVARVEGYSRYKR